MEKNRWCISLKSKENVGLLNEKEEKEVVPTRKKAGKTILEHVKSPINALIIEIFLKHLPNKTIIQLIHFSMKVFIKITFKL